MPKKFTKDYLTQLCCEMNITLLKNYEENELQHCKLIEFKCTTCDVNTSKTFANIVKYGSMCNKCSISKGREKAQAVIFMKYGVKNVSQADCIKEKKKETTLKNYGVEHNSQNSSIKKKKIETTMKNFGVEHPQQSEILRNKSKKTCIVNYGVEHPSQSEIIKQKKVDTNIKKYGVINISQLDEFKKNYRDTCLQRYGVEYPQQSEVIRNKSKITCLKKYGVEHPSQSNVIKQKMLNTCQEKYGESSFSKTEEFKVKIKETSLKKYGVEHPFQNIEIMEKSSKNSYKLKEYKFKSGNVITCQGYEPFALTELSNIYDESNILTGCKNVPTIWYNDESGKKHRHYVDIFIPTENKCIEVKSTWTAKKKKDNIFLKQTAAKELGYNYEIWVYNNKGEKVETYI